MSTATLYYSDKCPDTPAFLAALASYDLNYQSINITDSMPNLKKFLALRDNRPEFDKKKVLGQVGVPVLETEEGALIIDEAALKDHYHMKGV